MHSTHQLARCGLFAQSSSFEQFADSSCSVRPGCSPPLRSGFQALSPLFREHSLQRETFLPRGGIHLLGPATRCGIPGWLEASLIWTTTSMNSHSASIAGVDGRVDCCSAACSKRCTSRSGTVQLARGGSSRSDHNM